MKLILKSLYQVVLFATAAALVYFTYSAEYGRQIQVYFLLYALGLGYHLLFDAVKSRLFIWVFSFFLISSVFSLGFYYETARPRPNWYVLASNSFSFIGFLLIFLKLFKDYPPRWVFSKRSLLVFVILGVNVLFGYKIIQLVEVYNLSFVHFFYGFVYTIFKMILLSVGLIFFLTSRQWSRKLALLIGSFICFFLSDVIDTGNSLIFSENPIPGANILFSGLLCLALCFFYMYSTSPKVNEALENEKFF